MHTSLQRQRGVARCNSLPVNLRQRHPLPSTPHIPATRHYNLYSICENSLASRRNQFMREQSTRGDDIRGRKRFAPRTIRLPPRWPSCRKGGPFGLRNAGRIGRAETRFEARPKAARESFPRRARSRREIERGVSDSATLGRGFSRAKRAEAGGGGTLYEISEGGLRERESRARSAS